MNTLIASQQRIGVTFCIDSFDIGGTEMNAVRTAEAIDPERIDLRVVHLQADGPLYDRYRKLGIPMRHLPIPNLYSAQTAMQGLRLAGQLRDWKSDVLHAHDIYSNIFSAAWARCFSNSKVITSRRWWHATPRAGLPLLNRFSYRCSHRVLANCHAVAGMLESDEHVPLPRIVVIPNFLEERAFAETAADLIVAQRSAWRVPAQALLIGCVARLAPVKNHALLLRAAAPMGDDCHIVLIGDGPQKTQLIQLAHELGMSDRVHFVGEVMSQQNHHACFDVSALCSVSEGFPNSVIEAMAAGRPVVATAVGGVPEVVENDATGLLVPSNDQPAFTSALRRLQSGKQLRALLGDTARKRVRERYHQTSVMRNLIALYTTLVAAR
jgi:glycosyltransferase involved in cell wall biosynthesis